MEDERKRLTVRMKEALHRKLKVEAAKRGVTMNDMIVEMARKCVEGDDG